MDPEPLWNTQQWHGRHPSQKCIKCAISWRADHLLTSSSRNDKKEPLLVLDLQKQQLNNKAWETILKNRIPSTLLRSVFTTNFHFITGHDYIQQHLNRIGIKDFLMCPLCRDTEKVDLVTSKNVRVWQITWTMPTTRINGRTCQNYIGL